MHDSPPQQKTKNEKRIICRAQWYPHHTKHLYMRECYTNISTYMVALHAVHTRITPTAQTNGCIRLRHVKPSLFYDSTRMHLRGINHTFSRQTGRHGPINFYERTTPPKQNDANYHVIYCRSLVQRDCAGYPASSRWCDRSINCAHYHIRGTTQPWA